MSRLAYLQRIRYPFIKAGSPRFSRVARIVNLFLWIFILCPVVGALEDPPRRTPHIEMTERAMKDRVRVLQQQRFQRMPYLDRGFIRSEIRPEKIQQKNRFLMGQKKNLQALTERAILVYTPVRASRERISLAQRRILIALRNLFPEAKFEFDEKTGSLSGAGAGAFNSSKYRFTFRQPIFRGGILWNTLLKEKTGLEAERKDYESVVEDLVNEVSNGYFEYSRSLQVAEGQSGTVEKVRRFADISKQKYENQLISEIEHLNVQSLYGQMEYDLETSKQELELAKLELQRYLDLNSSDPLVIAPLYDVKAMLAKARSEEESLKGDDEDALSSGKIQDTTSSRFEGSLTGPTLVELTDLAYQHRSKLQVEAAKIESARLEEKIKWGELMPQVDVVFEFGKLGEAFNSADTNPGLRREFLLMLEFDWNVGGNNLGYKFSNDERAPSVSQFLQGTGSQISTNSLSAGLFDGLQVLASAKEAEVSKLDQITALEKTEKEVIHEVKQAYFDYQKARIQVKSSLQRVDYQDRLARLSGHRLEKNEVQISEYIQAEIDYLQAQTALHKALADYFNAKAKLNHAIGVRNYLPLEEWYGSRSESAGRS